MASVSIRMDDTLKQQTETVLEQLGLNMTTAFTMFAKAVVRENGIPFSLRLSPSSIASNEESLLKAIEDTRRWENLSGPFDTAEEAVASMLEN